VEKGGREEGGGAGGPEEVKSLQYSRALYKGERP